MIELKDIPEEVITWATGFIVGQTDGQTKDGYRQKLENLRDYISIVLKGGDATK